MHTCIQLDRKSVTLLYLLENQFKADENSILLTSVISIYCLMNLNKILFIEKLSIYLTNILIIPLPYNDLLF